MPHAAGSRLQQEIYVMLAKEATVSMPHAADGRLQLAGEQGREFLQRCSFNAARGRWSVATSN